MQATSIKVIFDTNVWISFLIGKRLAVIKDYLISSYIALIITQQLVTEIKNVTGREKLKKYFPKQSVNELIELLEVIAITVDIKPTYFINKDPKANYLVTGDKDLLEHNPFNTAIIINTSKF